VAHEENSSFQNVNTFISAIKTGASGETVQIRLSDGSSFFISPGTYLDLNLHKDGIVDHDLRERLQQAADFHAVFQKGLQLSARREHSRYEMRIKLLQRGYPETVITRVLDNLQRTGIINDRRFAEAWIFYRLQKKDEGPAKIKGGLLKRGVKSALVEEVMREYLSPQKIEESLAAATSMAIRKSGGDKAKFIRILQNRGFSWKNINKFSIDKFKKYYNDLR